MTSQLLLTISNLIISIIIIIIVIIIITIIKRLLSIVSVRNERVFSSSVVFYHFVNKPAYDDKH